MIVKKKDKKQNLSGMLGVVPLSSEYLCDWSAEGVC